jgi:hypothetical protein
MTMKKLVVLVFLMLSVGVLVDLLPHGSSHAADGSAWILAASGKSDSTGYLNIVEVTTVDLAATGRTYARLTSGSCEAFSDEAIMLEGQMVPETAGRYFGLLYPIGSPAKKWPTLKKGVINIAPWNGSPIKPGYPIMGGFDGGPPSMMFHFCLRKPGTYCVPYDDEGGQICQAEYPVAPGSQPPATISAGGPYSGTLNTPITFTATADNVPSGLGYKITWGFGDGTTATGGIVTHTYAIPAIYQVTVSLSLNFTGIPPLAQNSTTATVLGSPVIGTVPPIEVPSPWVKIGVSAPDDGGAWRFARTTRQDLIGANLTRIRVTSMTCTTPPDEAIVFEAQLQPTEGEDRSWDGKLLPVSGPARSLPALDPASGDVHYVPASAGTLIDAALDGLPPMVEFSVCVRAP